MSIVEKLYLQKHLTKDMKWKEATMPIHHFLDMESKIVTDFVRYDLRAKFTFSKHQYCYSILSLEGPCFTDYYSINVTFTNQQLMLVDNQFMHTKSVSLTLTDEEVDLLKMHRFNTIPLRTIKRIAHMLID